MNMRAPLRRLLYGISALVAILTLYSFLYGGSRKWTGGEFSLETSDQYRLAGRRNKLQEAFRGGWKGYVKHCFGHDHIHPVSNNCDDDLGGFGSTAIASLSTAIIMGQEDIVLEILKFVKDIDWKSVTGGATLLFNELTTRHFAGLLSAHDLLEGPFEAMIPDLELRQALYEQIVRLGDILSCAFLTPSGIPRARVYPKRCVGDDGNTVPITTPGTTILEFMRLSQITKNVSYGDLAQRGAKHLLTPRSESEPFPGILGTFINIEDGHMENDQGSFGFMSDSFYEYLLKAYVYDQDIFTDYFERWKAAAESVIRYVGSHAYGHPEWTFLPFWQGTTLSRAMDARSWSAGASFILGGMVTNNKVLVDYGLSIADAGAAAYHMSKSGLAGEYVVWTTTCNPEWGDSCGKDSSVRISTGTFNLRFGMLETWYYAYRATRLPKYREHAWQLFESLDRYCKTRTGYTGMIDVNILASNKKIDVQESFMYSEVFKYVYLTTLEGPEITYNNKTYRVPQAEDSRTGKPNEWVFNTEGHPLRVAGRPI